MRRPSFRRVSFDGRPNNRKPVRLTFKSVEEKDGIVWVVGFFVSSPVETIIPYIMRIRHLSFFAAAALLLAGCKKPRVMNFDYHLDWNNAGIDVRLTVAHPQPDTLTLYYCGEDYGGQTDIFTCVKNLHAEGCTVLPDSLHYRIKLFDFQKDNVQLTYRIEQSLPDTNVNCPMEVFRPNMTENMLYALGNHLFFLPDEEDTLILGAPTKVTWGSVPEFPVFCLYNPGKGTVDFEGDLSDLLNTVVIGDPGLHVDTVTCAGVTNYVVTVPRRLEEYNQASLKQFLRFFYTSALQFWEETPEEPYSLIVYPFAKIPFEVTGLGLDGGFCARYSVDADTILNHEREQTFAHEIGHHWIGFGADFQWFGEGFNDFQSIYLVTASGLHGTQNFIDFFNDYLDKLHHSEIRNLPNEEIWKNFWNLGDYSWIPYWRGSIYALRLMGMIEAQTGTEHAFKDLMMAVKPSMDTLTPESFLDITSQFIDKQVLQEDFERYIINAETMTLQGDLLPQGCAVRHKDDGTPYLVITDEDAFAKHFVL